MNIEDLKVGDYFRYTKEYKKEITFESISLWKVVEVIDDNTFSVLRIVNDDGVLVNSSPFRWTWNNIVEIVPYEEVVQLMLES
jgi:hypothetical protein